MTVVPRPEPARPSGIKVVALSLGGAILSGTIVGFVTAYLTHGFLPIVAGGIAAGWIASASVRIALRTDRPEA